MSTRGARLVALLFAGLIACAIAVLASSASPASAAASSTGSITGTVKAPGGGVPTGAIYVEAYDAESGNSVSGASVSDGSFTLSDLDSASTYNLKLTGRLYPNQWYRPGGNTGLSTEASAVRVGDTVDTTLLLGAGSITGTVHPPAGHTLDDAYSYVTLINADGDYVGYGWVDTDTGKFSFDKLLPGDYKAKFESSSGYPLQWYKVGGNVPTKSAASTIDVGTGVSNIDMTLIAKSNASVAGTVTESGGGTLDANSYPNVRIVNVDGDSAGNAYVAKGKYRVDGLYPGEYKVSFYDGSGTYRPLETETFTVSAGGTVTKDLSLARFSFLSGTVRGPGADG